MYGKKMNIWRLSLRNLRKQKFQSFILLILLLITSITMFLSEYIAKSMQEGIDVTKRRLGADLIVVPDRFVSRIEDALFLGKPCTVNFDKEWLNKIANTDGVKQVSFQLYISSLSLDCCDSSLQLIAFDMDSDFAVAPWLSKNGITSIAGDEIILGCNMKKKVGESVTYYGRKFKIIDVLQETGMGYDNCAFISYQTAYAIANDPKYAGILPFTKNEKVISMVLVKSEDNQRIATVKDSILDKYGDSGIAVYSTSDLVRRFADNLNNFVVYGNVFKILFLILITVALYGIYGITIHLRKSEFGTYFSFGTRKTLILATLITEMFIVVVSATAIGIGLVCLFTIPFHEAIKKLFATLYLMPNVREIIWISLKTFFVNSIVCITASVKSYYQLAHLEGILLIKPNNE